MGYNPRLVIFCGSRLFLLSMSSDHESLKMKCHLVSKLKYFIQFFKDVLNFITLRETYQMRLVEKSKQE